MFCQTSFEISFLGQQLSSCKVEYFHSIHRV
nr:MAG TPA: Fez1 [Caudoviricetes sp.]